MKLNILFFILFSISSFCAWAGYDGIEWGTTFAKVSKKYKSKRIETINNERKQLYTIIEAGGKDNVYATFSFKNDKLDRVVLLFSRPGTLPDLKTGDVTLLTEQGANELYAQLEQTMIQKYGKPAPVEYAKPFSGFWITKDSSIYMGISGENNFFGVGINYEDLKIYKEKNKGL